MFRRIAHVCLLSSDLNRSIEYYTKLGLKPVFRFTRNGRDYGVYLEIAPANFIEIFERAAAQDKAADGGISHFCLEVEDMDKAIAELDSRGVEHTPKILGCDNSYQIWLTDPDGNRFELHQYTPDSSQYTGRDREVNW